MELGQLKLKMDEENKKITKIVKDKNLKFISQYRILWEENAKLKVELEKRKNGDNTSQRSSKSAPHKPSELHLEAAKAIVHNMTIENVDMATQCELLFEEVGRLDGVIGELEEENSLLDGVNTQLKEFIRTIINRDAT